MGVLALLLLPKCSTDLNYAPAHPHATGVAVYPAMFIIGLINGSLTIPTSERLVVPLSYLIGDVQRVIGRDSDGSREIKQSVESHGRIRIETFTRHLLTVALGISTWKR